MTAADKRYARRFAVLGAVFLAVLLGSLLVGRYTLSPGHLIHMPVSYTHLTLPTT